MVLAAVGVVVVRALNEPEPSQNLVARDLLLAPRTLPGSGWELDTEVQGTLDKVLDSPTVLDCLGLPVVPDDQPDPGTLESRDTQTSEVYVVPGVSVQTAGVIAPSEEVAGDIVEALQAPGFDLCRDDFTSFARSLGLSEDTVDYSTPPLYTEPGLPELPEVVTASSRRIDVPLSDSPNDVDSYVIDYVFLAAGSAVACVGIWSYGEPVDPEMRDAVLVELVDRLTD